MTRPRPDESLFWMLVQADGMPEPVRQHSPIEGRRYRLDFAWPAIKLAVEIDGGQWAEGQHGGHHARDVDRWRNNDLVLAGWRILRCSTQMLRDEPWRFLEQVKKALGAK